MRIDPATVSEALFVLDELDGTSRWMTPADLRMEERDANEAGSVSGKSWIMDGKGRGHLQVFTGPTASLPREGMRAETWMA